MFGVSLGEPRSNPANSQALPNRCGVVTTVAYDVIGAMARTFSFSLQRRYGINQRERLLRIVTIGR
jgi:hypothetical protein